jgi:hypothetical protein
LPSLIRLDICRSDHLGPFLGVVADERAELGCRFCEPLFDLRVGEAGINLAVELADDLGRRSSPRADPPPTACLLEGLKYPEVIGYFLW